MAIDGINKVTSWGIPELPTVYDNGQSYYEILSRIRWTLNRMVEAGYIDYTTDFNDIIARMKDDAEIRELLKSAEAGRESDDVVIRNLIQQENTIRLSNDDVLQDGIDKIKEKYANLSIKKNFVILSDTPAANALAEAFKAALGGVCGIYTAYAAQGISACGSSSGGFIDVLATLKNTVEVGKGSQNITDVIILGGGGEAAEGSTSTTLTQGHTNFYSYITSNDYFPKAVWHICPYAASPWHAFTEIYEILQGFTGSYPYDFMDKMYALGAYLGSDDSTDVNLGVLEDFIEYSVTGDVNYQHTNTATTTLRATTPAQYVTIHETIEPHKYTASLGINDNDFPFGTATTVEYNAAQQTEASHVTIATATISGNGVYDRPETIIGTGRYRTEATPHGFRGVIAFVIDGDSFTARPDIVGSAATNNGYFSSSATGVYAYMGQQEVHF